MRPFLKNLTFSLVDLMGLIRYRPDQVNSLLYEIVAHINNGALKPLPYRAFDISHAADAFHFMASGQHIGKLVLAMHDPAVHSLLSSPAGPASQRALAGETDAHRSAPIRMSTCESLLAELSERGVELWVEGGKLRYRASKGALAAELRTSLRFYKEEIIAALTVASSN
jgi:hypothetical protein